MGATAEGEGREGNDPGSGPAGCHGGDGGPGVSVGGVDLGSVEVGLPIVTTHSKQVAS